MIKLKITQLGVPKVISTVNGEKEKNYLKAQEYGSNFLNFWVNGTTKGWKVGDTIEVEAVEEREYTAKDGSIKISYDIKLPRLMGVGNGEVLAKLSAQDIRIDAIGGMVKALYIDLLKRNGQGKPKVAGTDIDYPEAGVGDEPNPEDIPF